MAAPTAPRFLLASDVGGTFTDTVLIDAQTGRTWSSKVPSRNRRQDESVVEGVKQVVGALLEEARRGDVQGLPGADEIGPLPMHHGTTVATNALLERRGARTVLLTNAGFEDLLEIRRQDRPALYDARIVRPTPLVDRGDRFALPVRRGPAGEEWSEGREGLPAALERAADHVRAHGVGAVAVGLLHADVHPDDEAEVAAWLRANLPGVVVAASHEVWPEMREVERFETTVLNAYLAPTVAPYLDRLDRALETALHRWGGLDALRVIDSAGTLRPAPVAARLPASLLLSGPAGGVAAATGLVRALGASCAVTFDVGGTSTDVAFIGPEGAPFSTSAHVGGFACRFPALDLHTLGAGGGSVVWRDPGGHVQVGPRSQGAYPGPACYGRGGDEPTLTDALLLAGRIPSGMVFGGRTRPDRKEAFRVFERLAARIGRSLEETFLGAIRIAVEATAGGVHVVTTQRGHDAREAVLVAFGGAGPLIAAELATAMDMGEVVVPWDAGTFSARGMVAAPVVARGAVGLRLRVAANEPGEAVLRDAWDRAAGGLEAGAPRGRAAVRYEGQSHEVEVAVARDVDATQVRAAFESAHGRLFGHVHEGRAIEVVRLVVEHVTARPDPGWAVDASQGTGRPTGLVEETQVWSSSDRGPVERPARVLWRDEVAPGQRLSGPLIVPDATATTHVPPGWQAEVDARTRALRLTREGTA